MPPAHNAHELWAAAQLAPGEGIADGVARIEALLVNNRAADKLLRELLADARDSLTSNGDRYANDLMGRIDVALRMHDDLSPS